MESQKSLWDFLIKKSSELPESNVNEHNLYVYFFQDLPLVAIDSFKHMYLFPKFEDIK